MSEASYVARACRCCDSVPISEWAARLWATLDDSRPEVMVALDQWMEAGRPEVPPHWVTAQLPA